MENTLEQTVKILFKDDKGNSAQIEITAKQLIEKCDYDFYEMLCDSPCTSASCNNENQNFCDCGSEYEDYEICGIEFPDKLKSE